MLVTPSPIGFMLGRILEPSVNCSVVLECKIRHRAPQSGRYDMFHFDGPIRTINHKRLSPIGSTVTPTVNT